MWTIYLFSWGMTVNSFLYEANFTPEKLVVFKKFYGQRLLECGQAPRPIQMTKCQQEYNTQ
jgi:hypothetical protein